ncbi:DUF4167 domain-containing protein [Mesorhizobium sp. BAC0120]|uniref:DUF4167 domain-containing protein n=1 Tax=Mesorhizobium sp. BAC0120 TaxID=3090670 RepID=UPI00298C7915|nr:DUF4167 domain-containing protein [Mesorhizobium sp. BAC0120]MDW6026346.1 DUF4167 domain-containing protein [Mesorhizobium sp. BAC0120]
MRPQQQNRRMRGRNNNNRKGPNPLTRNYESNGPDVKIRGSAQQIAEKYATLARDAMSSGDRVMAENYLQHAEHYNRIIAAAQAQMPIQQFRDNRDDFDDDLDEEREEQQPENSGFAESQQQAFVNGSSPQPVIDGTPAEVALNPEAAGNGGQQRADKQNGNHNGLNGEENYPRRNRRSRRGRGRPDFEQGGDQAGEGEAGRAAEGSNAPQEAGSDEPVKPTPTRRGNGESVARQKEEPNEPVSEATAPAAQGTEAAPASQD